MSSERPFGALSISTSVSKPYLYWSTSIERTCSTVSCTAGIWSSPHRSRLQGPRVDELDGDGGRQAALALRRYRCRDDRFRTAPRSGSTSASAVDPAEADAHGALAPARLDAHGVEHVRAPTLPDEQAEPDETATPSRSKAIRAVSALRPGHGEGEGVGQPRRAAAEDHGVRSDARRARPPPRRAAPRRRSGLGREAAAGPISAAAPKPTMPATFSVPARAPRSCPPPRIRRVGELDAGRRPARSRRRPSGRRACGPTGSGRRRRGRRDRSAILPAACTASVCTRPPRACTMRAASATGWTTPVSLLASWTETSDRAPSRATRARREPARGRRRPSPSTGIRSTASGGEAVPVEDAGMLGRADEQQRSRPALRRSRRQRRGDSTVLFASVPPLVKTTSSAAAPTSAATWSRARSIAARAARPSAWTEDGIAGQLQGARHRLRHLGPQRRGGVVVEIAALGSVRAHTASPPS